jgi:hypothetical protein
MTVNDSGTALGARASPAPSWSKGDQRGHTNGAESARRQAAARFCRCTTPIHVVGITRTHRGRFRAYLGPDECDATAPYRPRNAADAPPGSVGRPAQRRKPVPLPRYCSKTSSIKATQH